MFQEVAMHTIVLPKNKALTPPVVVAVWLKQAGDAVTETDVVAQIESANTHVQLQAGANGTLLRILVPAGQIAVEGEALCLVGDAGEEISPAPDQAQPVNQASEPVQEVSKASLKTAASGSSSPVIPILMPQAGQSMEEGTLLAWKIKPGDRIEVGQIICEIETDKANMEVEAVDRGRVARLVVNEGQIVEVKTPIAYLADNDADVDTFLAHGGQVAPTPTVAPAPAQASPPSAPAKPSGSVIPILMPQAGQSMEEGTILGWHVAEGDRIEVGQPIFEIETDKANMEVEAVEAGRIAKIVAHEGDIVEIKVPVAYIADNDRDVESYIAAQEQTAVVSAPQASATSTETQPPQTVQRSATPTDTGRIKASPAARKLAAQKGIDLNTVGTGSGPGGRILTLDVDQVQVTGSNASGPRTISLTKMRLAIAKNLLWSKQNIPHFYAKRVVDAAALFATYRQTKQQFKCTVNDFVIRACAQAIREFPAFRSQFQNNAMVEFPSVNIGVAVGTDEGLTVPVVVDADRLSMQALAEKTRTVVDKARNGTMEAVGQGVFTITNMGMFGIEEFQAIVNPPESAILAVGAIREDIKVENEVIKPTRLMTLVLSVDHRVIDGVLAAQFLNRLKELLEEPEQLL